MLSESAPRNAASPTSALLKCVPKSTIRNNKIEFPQFLLQRQLEVKMANSTLTKSRVHFFKKSGVIQYDNTKSLSRDPEVNEIMHIPPPLQSGAKLIEMTGSFINPISQVPESEQNIVSQLQVDLVSEFTCRVMQIEAEYLREMKTTKQMLHTYQKAGEEHLSEQKYREELKFRHKLGRPKPQIGTLKQNAENFGYIPHAPIAPHQSCDNHHLLVRRLKLLHPKGE